MRHRNKAERCRIRKTERRRIRNESGTVGCTVPSKPSVLLFCSELSQQVEQAGEKSMQCFLLFIVFLHEYL